jgi:hypothetical protein
MNTNEGKGSIGHEKQTVKKAHNSRTDFIHPQHERGVDRLLASSGTVHHAISYLQMTRFIIAAGLATKGSNALFGNDRRHYKSGYRVSPPPAEHGIEQESSE